MSDAGPASGRHPAVIALVVILFAESALLGAATIYLMVELVIATPASMASAIALLVLTLIATAWLVVIAVNVVRGRAWTRAATVVWQVLQIAVAVGCFQGAFAQPAIGWVLLVPAILAVLLVFSKPVVVATRRDPASS